MPIHLAETVAAVWALLGVGAAIWAWTRDRRSTVSAFAAVLIAGWLLDVAVCGALSTPHDRYQARILWVLALVPVMLAGARHTRRAATRAATDRT